MHILRKTNYCILLIFILSNITCIKKLSPQPVPVIMASEEPRPNPIPITAIAKAEMARPAISVSQEPAQIVTVEVPKKTVRDGFTGILYTEIAISVNYPTEMEVGSEYTVRVNAFRGKVTTVITKGTTNTTFNILAARKLAVFLEGDAFAIVPKTTQVAQTLLPENYSVYWEFSVIPLKAGTHILRIKIGTSDSNELSFSRIEERFVTVKSSVKIVSVKVNQIKEHYLRNQVIYNSLGGCLVFLSGIITIKKKRRR